MSVSGLLSLLVEITKSKKILSLFRLDRKKFCFLSRQSKNFFRQNNAGGKDRRSRMRIDHVVSSVLEKIRCGTRRDSVLYRHFRLHE